MNLIEYLAKDNPEYGELYIDSVELFRKERSVIINFSSKMVLTSAQKSDISAKLRDIIPPVFSIKEINYSKIYCDEEIAQGALREIISQKFPSLHASLKEVSCGESDGTYNIILKCARYIGQYLDENPIIPQVSAQLEARFKEKFRIDVELVEAEETEEKRKEAMVVQTQTQRQNLRLIKVDNISPLIGSVTQGAAIYIADCESDSPKELICGKVSGFSERKTKSDKTMVSFMLEDYTGKIPCVYFPSEKNYPKVKQLEEGSEVLIQGEIRFDSYRNCFCCMVKYISLCELPKDFVVVEKPSKPAPENYTVVFPRKFIQSAQVNLFDSKELRVPSFFKGKIFVVFDIETTGLNYDIDRITEIGAVKIEDGIITETFSTLVNPEVHIKEDTVKLNGIDDELVKDSPTFEQVLPDFYKFTRGADIVAHNAEFDLKFIKYHAKKYGYYFENCVYDTLEIAKENLAGKGLSNYRLNTLCEYLDIDLKDHHRAWNDALATAQLFIRLYELKEFSENC